VLVEAGDILVIRLRHRCLGLRYRKIVGHSCRVALLRLAQSLGRQFYVAARNRDLFGCCLNIEDTVAHVRVDLAAQVVKIQNEKLAELCASRPDRFAAFASLTLQAPDLAVQELETAVRKQGLKGAAIGCIVDGAEFSDPKFHPVWAKAEQLGVPLFIHPQAIPELNKRLSGNGWLGNTIGYPLQTTIALSHLIFEGTFDRFPGLKVIAAHGGGFLPAYADRSDHACMVGPKGCNPDVKLAKQPTEYLKQIYFDSLIYSPEAVRHLADQVGAGQIVLGSDYPYPWQLHPVDHIFASASLSDSMGS